jgi:hypothetical protein
MKRFSLPLQKITVLRQLALASVLLGACGVALAQASAAKIMSVTGSAKAVDTQGRERALVKGGEVLTGDKIVTAEGALVQIRLNDGGFMSVRSATEVVFDKFVYDDKDASKSNFLVSLLKGGFRSITGLIGRTNPTGYQIRTATATVGVRGTDHEPMLIPEGARGPAFAGAAPGLYDKVNDGETFIRNNRGVLSLKRGEIGFSPLTPIAAPAPLQKIPEFYKVEIKTDARDPKDAAKTDATPAATPATTGTLMLRPSLAARAATLDATGATGAVATPLSTVGTVSPVLGTVGATSTLKAGVLNSAVIADPALTPVAIDPSITTAVSPKLTTLDTSAVIAPIATTTLSTTAVSPVLSTISPATTATIVPATTLTPISSAILAPVATTITPIATTTITPIAATIAPTTAIIAPAATIAPISAIIAPVTTVTPITTTTTIKPLLVSPALSSTVILK